MTSVTREIQGVKLQLEPAGETTRLNRRIGSCTIKFADESRDYIRVYGTLEDIWTRPERVTFEKELRALCADQEVISELFPGKELQSVRRFNPSEFLISKGWRCHGTQVTASQQ
ncbi:hypothetical protein D3C85_457060 [compost metagenome]|jgi:hypothetical protein